MGVLKWFGLPSPAARRGSAVIFGPPVSPGSLPIATPLLLDNTRQILLVTCVSVRDDGTYRLLSNTRMRGLRLYPTVGIYTTDSINVDNLDTMTIGLSPDECLSNHYEVCLKSTTQEEAPMESLKIPLHLGGCRFSHFPIPSLHASICLVHQLFDVTDETDIFIEEQEFLFTAMTIQSNLFLGDTISSPIEYVDSKVVLSTSWMQEDSSEDSSYHDSASIMDDEIQLMNSLVRRYESGSTNINTLSMQ
jgi:hypothetical protein